jgi:formylglycine-generating enzyme required for sulfatase activity
MVVMSTDGTLDPDTLEIDITSPDGTKTYHNATSKVPSEAHFPTSIAIVSNGDPSASVAINVSVWAAGVPLDVRQDRVLQIPTDRVAELDIVFSANCTPQVGLVVGAAVSKCAAQETCDPKSGSCVSSVVSGSAQPTFPSLEGGASPSVLPATDAGDATVPMIDAGGPSSCLAGGPGLSNCGATHSESCCTSPVVTGGTYYRTYANDGTGPTEESDPATVSTLRLDKYDVTVGRFRQFVNAVLPPDGSLGWTPAAGSGKHTHLNGGQGLANSGDSGGYETGWVAADDVNIAPTDGNLACDPSFATWTASAAGNENLPINCVNWWESYAFCIWDGGFLPSEAEWEYAAAGGSQQREYPWGTTAPGTASQYAIFACDYPNGSGSCTDVSSIAPVGAAPLGAGLWGQVDLAGNLWQRNLDWYATWADPCVDCAYLTPSAIRVSRGGDFGIDRSKLVPPYRGNDEPSPRTNVIGFRCARAPVGGSP